MAETKKTSTTTTKPFWFFALALGWLIPGAGHLYLGQRARGLILFFVISLTFWAGMAMGGVMTMDSQYRRGWWYAQMMCGVHGLAGNHRQRAVYKQLESIATIGPRPSRLPARPDGRQENVDRELSKKKMALVVQSSTPAVAFSGTAGLLNILCAFDAMMLAFMGVTGEPGDSRKKPKEESSNPEPDPDPDEEKKGKES